ncbi:MAG: NHLP bacteriocin system secretion protein, partial [Terriglobales bacterium]
AEERQGIFRKQALDRMASPDRLDEAIEIVSPKDWLLLFAAAVVATLVIVWSIWGQVPTTLTAQGIIIRPRKVVDIQSQAAGKITGLNLHVGQEVHAGDVIATLDQSELRKELEDNRARVALLEKQDREKTAIETREMQSESEAASEQIKALAMQTASIVQARKNAEIIAPVLKRRLDAVNEAVRAGIEAPISSEVVGLQKEYLDNQNAPLRLQAELNGIDSQRQSLQSKLDDLKRTVTEASTARRNEILQLRNMIAVAEVRLRGNAEVVAGGSGRILEVAANPGQVVSPGMRVASVELQNSPADLVYVSYFPIGYGKRIRPGMPIEVTPDTVTREEFGGILGQVVSVSPFAVTKEGASVQLGNPELAERLLHDGPAIEVVSTLKPDPNTRSGFRWSSSRGPELAITAGTTGNGSVMVEKRAPITYVLPFLRRSSGMD